MKTPVWDSIVDHFGERPRLERWIRDAVLGIPNDFIHISGPRDVGKSVLHEAITIITEMPTIRLPSSRVFNDGLHGHKIVIVEDNPRGQDLQKLWTQRRIWIHRMNCYPSWTPNETHWIQVEDSPTPGWEGMWHIVLHEKRYKPIKKSVLFEKLQDEAPTIRASIL